MTNSVLKERDGGLDPTTSCYGLGNLISLTIEGRCRNGDPWSIQIVEGAISSLPEAIDASIKELATKRIALPLPLDKSRFKEVRNEFFSLAQSSLDRDLIEKVVDKIQHITFSMLASQLQECVREFNTEIGANSFELATLKMKSNEWIAQLALKYGLTLPKKVQSFENEQLSSGGRYPSESVNILICDDCSYSGGQVIGLIKSLSLIEGSVTTVWNRKTATAERQFHLSGRIPDEKPPVRNIYFIIPFISSIAKENIRLMASFLKDRMDINVRVITGSQPIPTIKEVLTEEEQERFEALFDPTSDGTSLSVTDWRVADGASLPPRLIAGEILYDPPVKTSEPLFLRGQFSPYFDYRER